MSPEEYKTAVATILCLRLVNLHQATRRRDLVIKFKNPALLDEMETRGLCRAENNRTLYFPTVGSFALSSDARIVADARLWTARVIHVLRNLYEVYERNEPYTFDDLKAHATKLYDIPLDPSQLRIGLYLSSGLGALGSFGRSVDGLEINSFTIREHIITFESPEEVWDQRIESFRNQGRGGLFFAMPSAPDPLFEIEPIRGTQDWYFHESRKMEQKTLRCPFASPDLCPRYFGSLSLTDEIGATGLDSTDATRLTQKWKNAPAFAVLREQLPSVQRGDDRFSSLTNFCPEVVYDIYGIFASMLGRYTDEIDHDLAQQRLVRQEAPLIDPAWQWGFVAALHYTSCPTFSLLAGRASNFNGVMHELLDALLSLPGVDPNYVTKQVARLDLTDPTLAIGTAKEVLETCCKTILKKLTTSDEASLKLPALVRKTIEAIDAYSSGGSKLPDMKAMLNPLITVVTSITELRNTHGTGHGKLSGTSNIGTNEAQLAVGAASALCIYIVSCLRTVEAN